MDLFNLVGRLVLNTDDYDKGIDEAKGKNEEFEESTDKTSVAAAAKWAAIGAAVMKVVSTIKNLIVDSTQYADNIKNMAQIYGYTTQEIQEMKSVAEQSGKSLERVLRAIQSSGQTAAEYLGLTQEEYEGMVAEAYRYGTILSDQALDTVDAFGDRIAYMKSEWTAAITSSLAGEEGAEEALEKFFDNVMNFVEKYSPTIIKFSVKLLLTVAQALIRVLPQVVQDLISTALEELYSVNWFEVGINLINAIIKGVWEGLKGAGKNILKLFGIDLGDEDSDYAIDAADAMRISSNDYTVTESATQKIDVNIKYDGDTPISEMNAELVGGALAQQIDEILGRRLNG